MTVESLEREALQLSEDERADLASRLLESVHTTRDPSVKAAWDAEIDRRLDALLSGKATTLSLAEVRARVAAKLRKT